MEGGWSLQFPGIDCYCEDVIPSCSAAFYWTKRLLQKEWRITNKVFEHLRDRNDDYNRFCCGMNECLMFPFQMQLLNSELELNIAFY